MTLSVVVPCYNAAGTIGVLLDALGAQSWSEPWEIVVADNGSKDDSVTVVRSYQRRVPNLRLVDASDRAGAAHARNVGAREAAGEGLAFCDADDVPAPGWVAAVAAALGKHDFVASRLDFEKLNPPAVQKSRRNQQGHGLQQYTYPPFLPHAGGSGLGIKRSLHMAVGGFDETLAFLEDTDYCWRVQLAGTTLTFAGDAVVHCRFRTTLRGIFDQARNYGEYNVFLYKKYRSRGMGTLSPKRGIRAWIRLLRSVSALRSEETRLRWVREFGWRVGRLKGCLRYRVLAP